MDMRHNLYNLVVNTGSTNGFHSNISLPKMKRIIHYSIMMKKNSEANVIDLVVYCY